MSIFDRIRGSAPFGLGAALEAPQNTENYGTHPVSELQLVRGKEYPDLSAPDKVKAEYVHKLWAEQETEALARYKQATHNLLYFNDRHWTDWDSRRKRWEDIPNPDNELRVTMNYVAPILRARANRMMSGEVNWRAIPASNSYEERDRAKLAVQFLRGRWVSLEMETRVRDGLRQAYCTGACALKSFWNGGIGPMTAAVLELPIQGIDPLTGAPTIEMQETFVNEQGQPVQTEAEAFKYRPGDTDSSLRTIFNLRANPEARGWSKAEGLRWLIDTEVVPLAVAKEKYTEIAQKISVTEQTESFLTYERIAQTAQVARYQTGAISTPATKGATPVAEQVVVREYWEQESRFFPEGRLIVVVGMTIAYDGPFPQGIFPYSPLVDEPAVMSPWGRPTVNSLISPQNVINREWTAIVQEMIASGTGQYVAWGIPGIPQQITSDSKRVIIVPTKTLLAQRPISEVFQRLDGAQVSGDRWRMIEMAKMAMFDIGAFHEVSRGQIPPGLDSGVAIEHLLEQEAGQMKEAVEALKRTLILWAKHQLAIAKWGYQNQGERMLPVDRPDMGYLIESVSGERLPDPESTALDIEYFRPQSEAALRAEVKELMAGQLIDPRKGMQLLDLGSGIDGAFESQTRHYAKARWENHWIETGQMIQAPPTVTPPTQDPMTGMTTPAQIAPGPMLGPDLMPMLLEEDDDHLIHVDVHAEIALDVSKPPQIRTLVLQHIAQHRAILNAQLQAAAQAESQQRMAEAEAKGDSGASGPPQ